MTAVIPPARGCTHTSNVASGATAETMRSGTMTSPFASTPLGAIVAADYRAASVLDRFGLDFCCGGKRTLEEACKQRGLSVDVVDAALRDDADGSASAVPDATWKPDELTRYIVRRHHAYV